MSDPVTVYNSGFNLKLAFQLVQLTANLATNNFLSLMKNIDEITVTPNVSSILQWYLKSPMLNYFIFTGVS